MLIKVQYVKNLSWFFTNTWQYLENNSKKTVCQTVLPKS